MFDTDMETYAEKINREAKEKLERVNLACNEGPGTSCKGYDHEAQMKCLFYDVNRTNSACYWRVIDCYLCGCMAAQLDCRKKSISLEE